MGTACSTCFKGETTTIVQPDMAIRRQMQVEAAERRRNENDSRGIKDIDKVRRQQQRAAQMEKDELEAAKHGTGEPALRWQSN